MCLLICLDSERLAPIADTLRHKSADDVQNGTEINTTNYPFFSVSSTWVYK